VDLGLRFGISDLVLADKQSTIVLMSRVYFLLITALELCHAFFFDEASSESNSRNERLCN